MGKPVDYDELFPNRFLKAGLFAARPLTLAIADLDVEKLPGEDGGEKSKGVLTFVGTEKQLILNRTNAETIRAMFGRKLADWIGKRITFASEKDRLKGKEVDAIRIVGSPDMAAAFVAEFDISKKIKDKVVVVHVVRPLGVSNPSNRGEFQWIVPPPRPADRTRHAAPEGVAVSQVDDSTFDAESELGETDNG